MRSAIGLALAILHGIPGPLTGQQAGASRLLREPLFEISGTPITLATLITALGVFLVALIISRFVRRAVERLVVQRQSDALNRGNLRVTIRLIQYSILVTGLLVALHTLGVRLTALFAAGALFAVALGFAMQNMTANFISGVILLLERSIKPGDILEVEGQFVEIKEMGIRATIGRSLNEEDLIIPSSHLAQSIVKNFTLRDPLARLRVPVGVTYDSDMALVRRTLEETAAGLKWRSHAKQPVVFMKAFGNSSVDWEVSVWYEDPWNRLRRNSDLHEAIWWALKDAGITIAFPQLDLHLDDEVVDAMRTPRGGRASASKPRDG
jgi:small-conductance mechanosensitive channel